MKKPLLVLLFSSVLFADCTVEKEEKATNLWKDSQSMYGLQKSQTLSNALQICSLPQIKVDLYLTHIENQLNQEDLTLEIVNGLEIDLVDVRSMNASLFLINVRSRNNSKLRTLNDEIVFIKKRMETNQEKLNKLQAYSRNDGKGKGFGSGERLMLPVLFPNGKSRVRNNRKIRDLIERIEATLKEDKNAKFNITGYASSRGGARGNIELSKKRAYNIKKYLEKYIPKGHIDYNGKGESDLICNGGYPVNKGNDEYKCKYGTENEASSRRIEVFRRR